jgi:hypothetical protein
MPRKDSSLLQWLGNFSAQIGVYGPTVGLDAAGIKAQQDLCATVISSVQADETAHSAWRAAVAHSATVKADSLKALAAVIAHIETAPGCTDAIRASLGIVPPQAQTIAYGEIKVSFHLQLLPGRVVVHWQKGPLDGVNVYGQRGSETGWTLLGRDNRSPYDDLRPLAQPGTAELRRYRLIGVANDVEVTPPSDIVSITVSD